MIQNEGRLGCDAARLQLVCNCHLFVALLIEQPLYLPELSRIPPLPWLELSEIDPLNVRHFYTAPPRQNRDRLRRYRRSGRTFVYVIGCKAYPRPVRAHSHVEPRFLPGFAVSRALGSFIFPSSATRKNQPPAEANPGYERPSVALDEATGISLALVHVRLIYSAGRCGRARRC